MKKINLTFTCSEGGQRRKRERAPIGRQRRGWIVGVKRAGGVYGGSAPTEGQDPEDTAQIMRALSSARPGRRHLIHCEDQRKDSGHPELLNTWMNTRMNSSKVGHFILQQYPGWCEKECLLYFVGESH